MTAGGVSGRVTDLPVPSLVEVLREAGVRPGTAVALAPAPGGVGLAAGGSCWAASAPPAEIADAVRRVDAELGPRWVWWSAASAASGLVADGVHLRACWDLVAAHRLLHGGGAERADEIWGAVRELPDDGLPRLGQLDLLSPLLSPLLSSGGSEGGEGDPDDPVRPDGYLRPGWVENGPTTPPRAARWAALALHIQSEQERALAALPDGRPGQPPPPALPVLTGWSESGAELLAVELARSGLPLDRRTATELIAGHAGPRPVDEAAATEARRARDDAVRRHVPGGESVDLRNPAQVRAMLARIGIDVPDTRSWRLEPFRASHPAVDALLAWRKSERVVTTYGYSWLDRHVGPDNRLRGRWHGSDGAAGRMTAQAGLHNLPAELRAAVVAAPGCQFVRADLGQIEPRVLATVSGDEALAAASADPDLYSPVAARLGCDRPTAKVAVLAAMYGQTSGTAGEALRGLDRAYPVAMRFLRSADAEGQAGHAVRTWGGRRIRMWTMADASSESARAEVAARGRFARNAVVQGAAAELFKMWAVTVRAALPQYGGEIVLCLHDELLVHVPEDHARTVADLVGAALESAAARWAAGSRVRFVADVAVVRRWADAKP